MARPVGRMTVERRREIRRLHRLRAGTPVTVLAGRTHGRRSTYNDGCKCDECTDADADYQYSRRRPPRTR